MTPKDLAAEFAALTPEQLRARAARAQSKMDLAGLSDLCTAHLALRSRAGLNLSPRSAAAYRHGIHALLDWCRLSHVDLRHVDRDQTLRWIIHLESRGLAPATRRNYLSAVRALSRALRWAGAGGFSEPLEDIHITDPVPQHLKCKYHTDDELTRLIACCDLLPEARLPLLLGCDAGLRASEICALSNMDVRYDPVCFLQVYGKGARLRRVAATPRLAEALADAGAVHGSSATSALLVPISRRSLHRLLRRLAVLADVPPLGVHALRHTCATRLYARTRDLLAVQRHLGHASIKTTQIYAHLADPDYWAAVDLLEED